MDAKARLTEIIGNTRHNAKVEEIVDTLLAAGVTVPGPVQAGPVKPAEPVTSEEAALAFERHHFATPGSRNDLRHALDAAMPLLARDHGYIKLAEVELRARAWVEDYTDMPVNGVVPHILYRALTAPEAK